MHNILLCGWYKSISHINTTLHHIKVQSHISTNMLLPRCKQPSRHPELSIKVDLFRAVCGGATATQTWGLCPWWQNQAVEASYHFWWCKCQKCITSSKERRCKSLANGLVGHSHFYGRGRELIECHFLLQLLTHRLLQIPFSFGLVLSALK